MFLISKLIIETINYIFRQLISYVKSINVFWYKRFKIRNFEFKFRRQKFINVVRKNVFDVNDLKRYFDQMFWICDDHDIFDVDKWNMNKIDFRIDCDKSHLIFIFDIQKNLRLIDSKNKNYINDIEIINVANKCISFMLILKNQHILYKWILNNELNDDILFAVNESEYNNDDFAMKWLHHFIKHVIKKRIDQYIFLIIDEFENHMIYQFWKLIIVNNIIFFRFFAHFTHFTQSFDVDVFQFFKQIHDRAINRTIRNDDIEFNRFEFLIVFNHFRFEIFDKSTIFRNVFKRTKIVSFNFDVVLHSVRNKKIKRKIIIVVAVARLVTFFFDDENECLIRTFRKFQSIQKNVNVLRQFHRDNESFDVIDS